MRTIVLYYSRTGSNKYLAERVAKELNADIEEIRPKSNAMWILITSSLLGFGPGNRPLKHNVADYEGLIICGPIYMGQLILPLRKAILEFRGRVDRLSFITCCGSDEKDADGSFGYNTVFKKVRKLVPSKDVDCEAFPIKLVIPENKLNDGEYVMNTRLND